jgi:hypothetical protein
MRHHTPVGDGARRFRGAGVGEPAKTGKIDE